VSDHHDPLFVCEGLEFAAIVTGEKTVVGLQITHTRTQTKTVLRLFQLRGLRDFIEQILDDAPGGQND
jgi:hypothetical protein